MVAESNRITDFTEAAAELQREINRLSAQLQAVEKLCQELADRIANLEGYKNRGEGT